MFAITSNRRNHGIRNRAPLALLLFLLLVEVGAVARTSGSSTASSEAFQPVSAADSAARATLADSLFGRSGELQFHLVRPAAETGGLEGGYEARLLAGRWMHLFEMIPFEAKNRGRIDRYYLGNWPGERRRRLPEGYDNPEGFVRVTPANQHAALSPHFRLRDFVTKNQSGVWPKYVVVRPELIDKLELVFEELEAMGVAVENVQVQSGFRTPHYNRQGLSRGRATLSRHQYGDAVDFFIDNDGNGWMDDLNGDGRRNLADARLVQKAVERVEERWPDLVGGLGVYSGNRSHGPFLHVDVRGTRARWGRAV